MSDEDPTEQTRDDIHEHAEHARREGSPHASWISGAALTAALLAALAAIFGSLSGGALTDSGRAQVAANDTWAYYQAKTIKNEILQAKIDNLAALGKPPAAGDEAKLHQREKDIDALREKAKQFEEASEHHLATHEHLERGVTFFHIGIAIVAVAVLAKRRAFWYLSILLGLTGLLFSGVGFAHHLNAPAQPSAEPASTTPAPPATLPA